MDDEIFEPIPIRYTGLFADSHLVDANQFGRSVSGIARIGNNICHVLFFAEIARAKKHKIGFYVRPSKENGLLQEIVAVMNNGAMPMLFHPLLLKLGAVFVVRIFDAVVKTALGRKGDAALAIEKLHDLATQQMEFSSVVHTSHMQDKAWMQSMIEHLVSDNRGPLRELPAPVGHSVRQMQIGRLHVGPTIDEPAAEVLRARETLELGDAVEYDVFVEGVFKTNGACRLRLLNDHERIVAGKITDPALTIPNNIYTAALDRGVPLRVTAKPTLKNGVIQTLYVSDAKPEPRRRR